MKFGSLFSGIGGFDLGLERAGMQCAWQVEIDDKCRDVLARQFPGIDRSVVDVTRAGKRNLTPIDLICGGFPCQDLSVAGGRAGLAGSRSGLWFEFARIIEELAPRWVVIENVPGLLSSGEKRDMGILLGQMAKFGYVGFWRVLDAQYFGVAQRRRRAFIVGYLGNARRLVGTQPNQNASRLGRLHTEVLFEREGSAWNPAPSRSTGQRVADIVRGSSPSHHRKGRSNPIEGKFVYSVSGHGDYREGTGTLRASGGDISGGSENLVVSLDCRNLAENVEVSGTLAAKKTGGYSLNYQNPIAIRNSGRDSDSRPGCTGITTQDSIMYYALQAEQQHAIAYGRGVETTGYQGDTVFGEGDIWPTLSAESANNGGGANAILHSHSIVRRFTPTECERLQGFPDGWTAGQIDSARYRQLGNAVAVPVAEWLGRRIMAVEQPR